MSLFFSLTFFCPVALSSSQIELAQPQRVGDHRDRAEGHRRAGDHRAEQQPDKRVERARRNRHSQRVVDESEEEVLPDVAHRGAAQFYRADDAAQVALNQRHARALHRHVRPRAHRYAYLRSRKRGSVVNAVARHRHHSPFALQSRHELTLMFRQDFGDDLVNAQLSSHGFGGHAVVAGQHHYPQPFFVQLSDRLARGFLDRVLDAEHVRQPVIHRQKDHRRSAFAPFGGFLRSRAEIDAQLGEQTLIANRDRTAVNSPDYAFASDGTELGHGG